METIEKQNELIAEFMGYEKDTNQGEKPHLYFCEQNTELQQHYPKEMKFDSDWNWLMDVVIKIRKISSYDRDKFGTDVNICNTYTEIISGSYGNERGHSELHFKRKVSGKDRVDTMGNTFSAVVEYIEWYN